MKKLLRLFIKKYIQIIFTSNFSVTVPLIFIYRETQVKHKFSLVRHLHLHIAERKRKKKTRVQNFCATYNVPGFTRYFFLRLFAMFIRTLKLSIIVSWLGYIWISRETIYSRSCMK